MTDELFTVAQAAQYLQICDKTVRRLINNESLLAFKVASTWRIKKTDIDEYLQKHSNKQKGGVR